MYPAFFALFSRDETRDRKIERKIKRVVTPEEKINGDSAASETDSGAPKHIAYAVFDPIL